MRKILFFVGCLILSLNLCAQQPLLRLYTDNGGVRDYKLEDIEQILHISRTDHMIMEVFQANGKEDVYPAQSLQKLLFTTDSLGVRILTAHVFDQPRHFPLHAIDSIVFSRLEPKIVENISVVDAQNWDDIISVEENTIVFRAGSTLASGITTNWFVAGEPSAKAPNGFLRKVTGIRTQGNQFIATTEEASLFDVVEDGVISYQIAYTEDDLQKQYIDPTKRNNYDKSGTDKSLELNYVYTFADGKGEINFALAFLTPEVAFNLVIQRRTITQLLMQLKGGLVVEPKIKAELKTELFKTTIGPAFVLPKTILKVGIIPVVITNHFIFQMALEANISVSLGANIKAALEATIGMEYNRDSEPSRWSNLSSMPTITVDGSPKLDLGAGAALKLSVGPLLNMDLYGRPEILNGHLWLAGFVEAEVDFVKNPWWKINAGAELTGGTKSSVGFLNYTIPYKLTGKMTIIQAANIIDRIQPPAAAVGDTIRIQGSRFGDSRGTNYVAFKFGETVMPVDRIRATNYVRWQDGLIEVVVPPGFDIAPDVNELDVDLLVNAGGYWSTYKPFQIIVGPRIISISPDTLQVDDPLVIRGKDFGQTRNGSRVYFDDRQAQEYLAWGDTEIRVKVPPGIEDGAITVEVDERTSNAVTYVMAVPVITSIDPREVFPGDELEIKGRYFGKNRNNSFVSFDGKLPATYIEWSETLIMVKVPDDVETGVLWVNVDGKNSNEMAYVVPEVEVTILPPRYITYEMTQGATEVEHAFEAYAKPDSVYRFSWNFDDGNTFSEVVQKGQRSRPSHLYIDVKDGDKFHPTVNLYDLDGRLLATDDITIIIESGSGTPDPQDEITVGNLVWMTRNLDVDVGTNWLPKGLYCEEFNEWGCKKEYWKEHTEYGRLYDWDSAIAACASIGWRLPSLDEWLQLIDEWGGQDDAGGKLKSTNTISKIQTEHYPWPNPDGHPAWYEPNTYATNESGFSALPGGYRVYGSESFDDVGSKGFWWSATESSARYPIYMSLHYESGGAFTTSIFKANGFSVRCVRDAK